MSRAFTPFCLRVSQGGDRWRSFAGGGESRELDTVGLIVAAPEFLGLGQSDEPLPRAAAPAPQAPSGHVLLSVTEAGGVVTVACPDAATPANGLVGEVLATGGRLWRQPYESLVEPFESFLGMSLVEWIARRAGPTWSADAFRAGAEECLRGGRFPVILLVERDDPAVQEAAAFLVNMNIEVRLVTWECHRFDGNELVRPRVLAVRKPAAAAPQTAAPKAPPAPEPPPKPVQAPPAERKYADEHTSSAAFGGAKPETKAAHEPFPAGDWSEKQREMLGKLVELDGLGMVRRGFEYFVPGALEAGTAEGAIVVSVQADRWPAPAKDEVIVVVRADLLGAWFQTAPEEIVDFLASLRRAQRKEHKGAVLLLATSVNDASQMVNELKALKELASSSLA